MKLFYLLILLVSGPAWAAGGQGTDRFLQVSGWTGHYSFSGKAECSEQPCIGPIENVYPMASPNKTSQSFSISLNLDEMKVEDETVVWQGESSCKIQSDGKLHAWIPETPIVGDVDWNVERIYPCIARLIIDLYASDYTLEVDFQDIEFSVSISGTGMADNGTFVPVNETKKNSDTFSGPYMGFDLDVWDQLPEQGLLLMGSYALGKKPAQGMDPEVAGLYQSLSSMTSEVLRSAGMTVTGQVRWNLSPDLCSDGDQYKVSITWPMEVQNYVFRDGKLTVDEDNRKEKLKFEAEASNGNYQDIFWNSLPDIPDSTRKEEQSTSPIEKLSVMTLSYTGVPENNKDFGEYEISATLGSAERCTQSGKKKMQVFFERDGEESPPDEPNWFYYWFQTSAGQGHYEHAIYDNSCDQDVYGWYNGFMYPERIHLCEGVQKHSQNDRWGMSADGIDSFATVVMHEWQHKLDHDKWWGQFDQKNRPEGEVDFMLPQWHEYGRKRESFDPDGDSIPNWADAFPFDKDKDNDGYKDSETSAYAAGNNWRKGTADKEDWACPGKQCDQ